MNTALRVRKPSRVLGEVTGAVADLGTLVPLVAALVMVNGLEARTVLVVTGAFIIVSGAWTRLPFPVQPLKALTAVAVAQGLAPEVIHAAGLQLGLVLLLFSVGHVADLVARAFTRPVVRALQFGVGLLLVWTAWGLAFRPPDVFTAGGDPSVLLDASLPGLSLPSLSVWGTAFVLLVVPQLPLTFGNAVVAVTDVSHRYFGPRASRVTPSRVCISAGVGNVASALVGGMPMCHGSSGLTAHVRLGARTAVMSVLLGSSLIGLGLAFGPHALTILGLLPAWGLAVLLAYVGTRHALLVADLRGHDLAIAVVTGAAGAATRNLMVTTVAALVAVHLPRLRPRGRGPRTAAEPGASVRSNPTGRG